MLHAIKNVSDLEIIVSPITGIVLLLLRFYSDFLLEYFMIGQ